MFKKIKAFIEDNLGEVLVIAGVLLIAVPILGLLLEPTDWVRMSALGIALIFVGYAWARSG
ncbi:MAG: hypothetical protein V1652_02320 [bacterium]